MMMIVSKLIQSTPFRSRNPSPREDAGTRIDLRYAHLRPLRNRRRLERLFD